MMVPPSQQPGGGNLLGDTAARRGEATPAETSCGRRATAAHPATPRAPPWRTFVLVAGHPVGVRQLEPTDAPNLMDAFRHLSPASRRQRFLSTVRQYTPDRVDALTSAGRPGRYALIAARLDDPRRPIIAIGEFVTQPDTPWIAEPAIAVLDPYQGRRLGTRLWRTLLAAAQQHGVTHLTATLDVTNTPATRLLQRAGARIALDTPGVLRADLDITPPPRPVHSTPATQATRVGQVRAPIRAKRLEL
jgi:ribosomal protein S18 acetylase RimI-like enzyme